ncbi:streptophobe family protein [Streptomyces sp. MK5]|uniref:streptophobe family protein n=1 Tax=Streptomyces sp. MK5 TaxID=3064253 RepID=UPI00274068D7|nr:streptophobe family protein [Streptomyces sp. MK5]
MSAATKAATKAGTAGPAAPLPWLDVLLSAIACVSWALTGMAATVALGLHLLGADSAGSLGPMTAAVVALGAGGAVTPSGDVSVFGLKGATAHTAIQITPLGVSLVGALLLSWFFLRSLRAAGIVIAPAELLARAGAVVVLFVAMLGGLAWAGHDVVTIDGASLGLDRLPGGGNGGGSGGGGSGGLSIPGLGDLGDIGGLLPDNIGKLIDAKAAVGFRVDTAPTLLGGLGWSAGILLIALLASRRTPLPRGWTAVHRVVRPAVSALVTVLLTAVVAGVAAAGYAAVGDPHPRRIAGAALLGAPGGVWLGVPVGLFVPWDGRATGVLATLLPDPLDRLLDADSDRPVTLARLADLDGRVWLLGVAAALMMLLAGVLTAVRTPVAHAGRAAGAAVRGSRALGFVGRCALRLGLVTAAALPLLAWLTDVSVNASLSVLGVDAFGAGIELHGHLGTALLLGAVWGAGAGAAGALLATAAGVAGRRAAPLALALGVMEGGGGAGGAGGMGARPGGAEPTPGRGPRPVVGAGDDVGRSVRPGSRSGVRSDAPSSGAADEPWRPAGQAGPYSPGTPFRPPNPATNPYLRLPGELRGREKGGRPEETGPRPPEVGAGPPEFGAGPPEDARPTQNARPAQVARPSVNPRPEDARPVDKDRSPKGVRPSEAARPAAPTRPPEAARPPEEARTPDDTRPTQDVRTPEAARPTRNARPPANNPRPEDTQPSEGSRPPESSRSSEEGRGRKDGSVAGRATPAPAPEDVAQAPTMVGPVAPPPRPHGRRSRPRSGTWPPPPPPPPPVAPPPDDGPPDAPPPPPPPRPPRTPRTPPRK